MAKLEENLPRPAVTERGALKKVSYARYNKPSSDRNHSHWPDDINLKMDGPESEMDR